MILMFDFSEYPELGYSLCDVHSNPAHAVLFSTSDHTCAIANSSFVCYPLQPHVAMLAYLKMVAYIAPGLT